jgi:hypothetical protein
MAITPGVPGAADDAWSTPARPPGPVVGAVPPTHEVAPPSAIAQPGSPGPLGDDASGTVAGAVASSEARYHGHEVLTHPQGSEVGVQLDLPPVTSDWSKHTGGSDATSYNPEG